jgi:hypothetical protein
MKHLKGFLNYIIESMDDKYNYDNAKSNPNRILIKFVSTFAKSNFIKNYTASESDFVYFNYWEDLNHLWNEDGLEMTDGLYYPLYKNIGKEDLVKWISNGRRGNCRITIYFLNYGKDTGEIAICSYTGTDYNPSIGGNLYNVNALDKNHKILGDSNFIHHTYCTLEKDGKSRVVEVGSIDHRGYFEVVGVK